MVNRLEQAAKARRAAHQCWLMWEVSWQLEDAKAADEWARAHRVLMSRYEYLLQEMF